MDDIRTDRPPASESAGEATPAPAPASGTKPAAKPLRSVGPESEVRGGHEASDETLDP